MLDKRKIPKSRLIAAFALATLIFILGIIIGNTLSNAKVSMLESMEEDLKMDILAIETQNLLMAENPCSIASENPLTEELYKLSSRLATLENERGPNDPTVLKLKEYTSLLEIQHWLLLKKMRKECNANVTLILYFYSNLGDCSKCEEQGYVLTHLRKKFPNINVYSFDINIHDIALDTLKETYEVKGQTPILIINDETYYGFKNKAELEELIFS